MNKLILEEVNRIKQVMGLITEGRIPDWLYDLVAISTGRSTGRGGRPIDFVPNLKSRMMNSATDFKKLADDVDAFLTTQKQRGGPEGEEAIIFRDAVDRLSADIGIGYKEALEKVLKGELDYKLLQELSIAKAARIVQGINLPTSIERILDTESALWNAVKGQNESTVNAIRRIETQNGPEAAVAEIDRRLDMYRTSGYSDEIKKYWEEFYMPLRRELNQGQLNSQIDNSRINFDDAELAAFRDSENSVKVPSGPIKEYLQSRFSRFGKLTPEQQKDLVEEVGAKVAGFFEKTYSKMTQNGESFDTIQKMFDDKRIPPLKRREIMLEAIKKSNTSLGLFQDSMDWLVKYLTGYDMETGTMFWKTSDWKTTMKNWFYINLAFGVVEFFLRGYFTREEDRDNFGKEDVDIFLNRFDIYGLALRLIPIPTIARLAISELGQSMIEAGGSRMPTAEEISKSTLLPLGSTRNAPTSKPDYEKYKDLINSFSDKCTWVKGPDGKDLGVWTYDLKEGLRQIVPGEDGTPSPSPGTTGYESKLESFKKFLTDKKKPFEETDLKDNGDGTFNNGIIKYKFVDATTGFEKVS